jgi:hypothetical protein
VSWLLVAAGVLVALGAAVAIGARGTRGAGLGILVALVFAPFVADPLLAAPVLAFRIVAGTLAAFLVLVAGRRSEDAGGSPLGLPAALTTAAAGYVAGLGATAVGLPAFGTPEALAPGLACLAVAVAPVALARDPLRLGAALLVLASGSLLVRTALAGVPPALETLLAGGMLVAVAAAVVVLAATTATAEGRAGARRPAPRGVAERRRPPAPGSDR